jgi:hypothetical protein
VVIFMKVKKEICMPGKVNNEDCFIYNNDSYILVLDGSTGLCDNRIIPGAQDAWSTDAQWFVQTFSSLVKWHMDNFIPIKDLVSECITELTAMYHRLVPDDTDSINQPSASMALIKKTKDIVEIFMLGDLTVLIQQEDGSVEELKDKTVSDLDKQIFDQIVNESQNDAISVLEAVQLPQIQELLKLNRMKKNTESGYWILGLDTEAVPHALYKQLPMDSWNRIFICSDGFYAYTSYFYQNNGTAEQFMNDLVKNSFKSMLKKIRKAENADALLNKFTRFKISDDATAVLIVSDQEKREQLKNNLLMRTNIIWHRAKGKSQSNLMTFGIKKSYVASVLVALAALLKVIYDVTQSKTLQFNLITWGIMLAPVIFALITALSAMSTYMKATSKYLIFADPRKKSENLKLLKLRKEQKKAEYQIRTFFNGSEVEHFIMSTQVNDFLLENKPIVIKDMKRAFTLVEEVKKYVPAVMELTLQKLQISYNGKLLRQITDLYPGTSRVDVQKTRYFDGQCTHEIVYKQFKSVSEIGMAFDGKRLLMDDDNFCFPLNYSSCANFIGASTMVFTRDHKIIIGRQGALSKANPGRYAPSGSGSAVYADIKKTKKRLENSADITFQDVLITAMIREFCEECNYPLEKGFTLLRTQLIGYARLLERGGKPDYFGVSYIDDDSENVFRSLRHSEYGLSRDFSVLHFHQPTDIPKLLRKFCKENQTKRQLSIQIEIITQILEHIEETQGMDGLMRGLVYRA